MMKKFLNVLPLLLWSSFSMAQEPKMGEYYEPYRYPRFPGGDQALYKFVHTNFQFIPQEGDSLPKKNVRLCFLVNADSTISDIEVPELFNEVNKQALIHMVKKMPKWSPALAAWDKPIPMQMCLPIKTTVKKTETK